MKDVLTSAVEDVLIYVQILARLTAEKAVLEHAKEIVRVTVDLTVVPDVFLAKVDVDIRANKIVGQPVMEAVLKHVKMFVDHPVAQYVLEVVQVIVPGVIGHV